MEVDHQEYFLLAAARGHTKLVSDWKCEEQGREPADLGRCRQAGDMLQQECIRVSSSSPMGAYYGTELG